MTLSLVVTPPRGLSLVQRPPTPLAPLDVRVAIGAAGICHTDFYILDGSHPAAIYPRVPGHEFSGTVTEVGSNVPATLRAGTRVGLLTTVACDECEACLAGRPGRCNRAIHLGFDRDGGWQEHADVPWRAALPIPDHVSLAEAALFEPTANGNAAVEAGRIGQDDHVVVIGPGAIGILSALIAAQRRPRSLTILGLATDAERLAIARRVTGADIGLVDGDHRAKAATLLSNASVTIQCAPSLAASALAIEHLQHGGRLVLEGYAGDAATLPIGADAIVDRSLELIGVNGWTRHDYETVAAMVASRQIELRGIPLAHFALNDHEAAVQAAHGNRGILRAMFEPNAEI